MRRVAPTDEWGKQRLGKLTASEISKIIGLKTGMRTYVREKITEKITGTIKPVFDNDALLWGASTEIDCVIACLDYFQFEYFGDYDQRFFEYDEYSGGSPDGVGDDFIVEIKCPYDTANHIQNILIEDIQEFKKERKEYYWQCIFNAIILKKQKVKFCSFDPEFLIKPLHIFEFNIADKDIELLKNCLGEAEGYYKLLLEKIF